MDIILHSTSKDELKGLISETVKEELTTFFSKETKSDNQLYTRKQVTKLLGISLPTLASWTKQGIIRAYRIGNSVRYKAEDVEKSLLNIKSVKYLRGRI